MRRKRKSLSEITLDYIIEQGMFFGEMPKQGDLDLLTTDDLRELSIVMNEEDDIFTQESRDVVAGMIFKKYNNR